MGPMSIYPSNLQKVRGPVGSPFHDGVMKRSEEDWRWSMHEIRGLRASQPFPGDDGIDRQTPGGSSGWAWKVVTIANRP